MMYFDYLCFCCRQYKIFFCWVTDKHLHGLMNGLVSYSQWEFHTSLVKFKKCIIQNFWYKCVLIEEYNEFSLFLKC